MTDKLLSYKLKTLICGNNPVFVCVGADLAGGDCLGPLVGQMLIEDNLSAYVYGTLKSPVNALNVDKIGKFVRGRHPFSRIVAVDSMVGEDVGSISIANGGLLPGAADGKRLNPIGDVSLTAVTTPHSPRTREFSLVRMSLIYNLARRIADIIAGAVAYTEEYDADCLSRRLI